MRKLRKCRKALSPVVAAIILIAVTVAVSIAVAAWMGALTFTFMQTEELKITSLTWGTNYADISMTNTGASSLTISSATVDDTQATDVYTGPSGTNNGTALPSTGYSLSKGSSVTLRVYKPSGNWASGTKYNFVILTKAGNQFPYGATKP